MRTAILCILLGLAGVPSRAQVAVHPPTTTPAAWERFAIRVINQTDTATVAVRIEVPEAVAILGVEPGPGWRFRIIPQSTNAPAAIEWTGGRIGSGEFQEFAFLGRPKGDARQSNIVFPVQITRANGSVVEWRRPPGQPYAAPRVRLVGTVAMSPRGAMMMAGVAIGLSLLALIVVIAKGTAPARGTRDERRETR